MKIIKKILGLNEKKKEQVVTRNFQEEIEEITEKKCFQNLK